MHDNPELQNQSNNPSSPLDQQGDQSNSLDQESNQSNNKALTGDQNMGLQQESDESLNIDTNSEHPSDQDAEAEALTPQVLQGVSLISMYVTDEGLDEAKSLLTAWAPDVPLSIFVVASKESHVSYFEEYLASDDTFALSILNDSTSIESGHIYVLPPTIPFKLKASTLTACKDSQQEQFPGELFLTTYGKSLRHKALVLLFAKSIADYAGTIKQLTSCRTSIIHHSPSSISATPQLDLPTRHLVDQSVSIRQVAVYTQRFIESFNPDTIAELDSDPQNLSYVQHIGSILGDHIATSLSYVNPAYVLFHVYQRMRLFGFNSIHQYIERLVSDQVEVTRLAKRVSIRSTFFFNDLRSQRVVAKTILPSIVKDKGPDHVIRIWFPGCSSGEDALSLSMLIHEHAESLQTSTKVQLLCSDNNKDILEFARNPRYSPQGLSAIPAILKEKFFELEDGVYTFVADYKEQYSHSLIHITEKGPFDQVDIIYCRDILSKLSEDAQKSVLEHFSKALSPKGILVLGSNETGYADLPSFIPVKNQPFIYKPIQATISEPAKSKSINLFKNQDELPKAARKKHDAPQHALTGDVLSGGLKQSNSMNVLHKDLLLQIQAPVSLMIRPDFTIVDHIGNVGRFISWPNNGHTINLLEAFPKEVQEDLRFAVNQVLKSKIALKSRPITTEYDSIFREFRLQVHPINLDESDNDLIQVIFLETDASIARNIPVPQPEAIETPDASEELKQLQTQLDETQQKLKIVSGLLKDSKELLKQSKLREKEAVAQASKNKQPQLTGDQQKIVQQNNELRSTNTELLELNRDLVRRIEELRRNMNRKLKEIELERENTKPDASSGKKEPAIVNKNLELLLPKRHEVRTSLTSIIGFADLLADRMVDKDNRELARYIGKSGHRLSENLAPLLNLDLPEENASDLVAEETPIFEEDIVSSNRVLVVEDSDATRRLLTLVLSDRFECEVAADGSEAIEKAEKEVFKAVLMDIDLGKGPNGIDVLDHLRQKNYYRTVPFMAVTSMATPQDRSMLLRKGFDAFVPKPFQKGLLLSALDKMIDNSAGIA